MRPRYLGGTMRWACLRFIPLCTAAAAAASAPRGGSPSRASTWGCVTARAAVVSRHSRAHSARLLCLRSVANERANRSGRVRGGGQRVSTPATYVDVSVYTQRKFVVFVNPSAMNSRSIPAIALTQRLRILVLRIELREAGCRFRRAGPTRQPRGRLPHFRSVPRLTAWLRFDEALVVSVGGLWAVWGRRRTDAGRGDTPGASDAPLLQSAAPLPLTGPEQLWCCAC